MQKKSVSKGTFLTEGLKRNCSSALESCAVRSTVLIPAGAGLAAFSSLIDTAIGPVWLASGNHHKFRARFIVKLSSPGNKISCVQFWKGLRNTINNNLQLVINEQKWN